MFGYFGQLEIIGDRLKVRNPVFLMDNISDVSYVSNPITWPLAQLDTSSFLGQPFMEIWPQEMNVGNETADSLANEGSRLEQTYKLTTSTQRASLKQSRQILKIFYP